MWSAVSVFGSRVWNSIMSEPPLPEEELAKENKFAGEEFGTDNVRTVFAGSSNDSKDRETRIIILVGPSGTGKSTLIDCMCNYFYGAKLDEPLRFKIADERFDNTTPKKSIIKYVFNGTEMPYRPVVIDTPGIGDASGVKADDELKNMILNWLAFDPRSHIHAIGLVLPSSMTRLTPRIEAELQHTLSLFPSWMQGNVVPMVTKCDGSPEPSAVILRHFDLHNNRRFRFNTSALYQKPSENYLNEQLRQMYWDLSMSNMDDFFDHVGRLHPQCIEEQLNPTRTERIPRVPPALLATKPPTPSFPPPPPPVKTPQSAKSFEIPSTISEMSEEPPAKPPREAIPAYNLPQIPTGEVDVPDEPVEEFVSIKRYTYDPNTLSHNVHMISEKRTKKTGSEPGSKRSSVVAKNNRSSFHENGLDSGFYEKVHSKLEDGSKGNGPMKEVLDPRKVRETDLDERIREMTQSSSVESSPTENFRKNPEFSLRSTASDWQYTPSNGGNSVKRYRPGSGVRRSVERQNLTPLRREAEEDEGQGGQPLQPLQPVQPNGGQMHGSQGQIHANQLYGDQNRGGQPHGNQVYGSQSRIPGQPTVVQVRTSQPYGAQDPRSQVQGQYASETQPRGDQPYAQVHGKHGGNAYGAPEPAPRDSLRRSKEILGNIPYENVPGNNVPPPVPRHNGSVVAPLVKDTDIDADLEDGRTGNEFHRNDLSRTSFHSSSLKSGRPASNRPDSSNYGDDWGSEPAPPVPQYEDPPQGPAEWEAVGYKPNPKLEPPKSLVVASRPYYYGDRREPQNEKRLLRDVEAAPVPSSNKYQYSQPLLLSPGLRRPEENRVEKPKKEILNCCFFLLAPIMVIFIFAAIMLTLILAH
ncbi:hypothetical protein L596_014314 [Steinernema carpocapsae]|uniref:Rad50/SbcC-type AAA domain-containing protein n=1 Tax=Steinernema carpocapsae TaxID=34508 RepID=A0A4U5NCI0_STECR|nr:hypothetical protein L596_014314 [Steinernema carpocapsae]